MSSSFALKRCANCRLLQPSLVKGSSLSQATSAAALEQNTLGDSSFSQATSTAAFRAEGLVVQRLTRLWTKGIAGAELEVGLCVNFSCLGD